MTCREGCLNNWRTTQEKLEKELEAAKAAAAAQAAAHQAALAQAGADGATSCGQAEQQAAQGRVQVNDLAKQVISLVHL